MTWNTPDAIRLYIRDSSIAQSIGVLIGLVATIRGAEKMGIPSQLSHVIVAASLLALLIAFLVALPYIRKENTGRSYGAIVFGAFAALPMGLSMLCGGGALLAYHMGGTKDDAQLVGLVSLGIFIEGLCMAAFAIHFFSNRRPSRE